MENNKIETEFIKLGSHQWRELTNNGQIRLPEFGYKVNANGELVKKVKYIIQP